MKSNLMLDDVGVESGIIETKNPSAENECNDTIKKRWKPGAMTKYCPKCTTIKSIEEFFERTPPRQGYQSYCKACHSHRQKTLRKDPEWKQRTNEVSIAYRKKNKEKVKVWDKKSRLKANFGISLSQFNEMIEKQNNKCLICLSPFSAKICVDHDHKTEKIRGLLCSLCNSGLGYFRDNTGFLENAISYLKK